MNGFPDNCEYCGNKAEYICLVENDENPLKHHTEYVCNNCMEKIQSGLIEAWTWMEWVNQ